MPNRAGVVALGGVAAVLLAIQLVPTRRTNPPLLGTLVPPPDIAATLRRACYDCHSNETRWPWYSHIAPLSWLVVHDVMRGREEVNFSEWGTYYPTTRRRKLEWMRRTLHQETMPPWAYRLTHPGARLTDTDQAALEQWIESALAMFSTEDVKK